jgi:hypothetical protein
MLLLWLGLLASIISFANAASTSVCNATQGGFEYVTNVACFDILSSVGTLSAMTFEGNCAQYPMDYFDYAHKREGERDIYDGGVDDEENDSLHAEPSSPLDLSTILKNLERDVKDELNKIKAQYGESVFEEKVRRGTSGTNDCLFYGIPYPSAVTPAITCPWLSTVPNCNNILGFINITTFLEKSMCQIMGTQG